MLPAGPLGGARRGPARRSAVSDRRGAQPARRPAGGPMSGGGGAAGPRLYGYGSALPPAALLRRGLAAAASGAGSAAVGTTVAGAAPLPSLHSFSSSVGCASAQVSRPPFLFLSRPPRRALQIAQRERDDLTLRPFRPPFWFILFFIFVIIVVRPCFFPCSAPWSLPATRTAVPLGESGALRMRLPGIGGADSEWIY